MFTFPGRGKQQDPSPAFSAAKYSTPEFDTVSVTNTVTSYKNGGGAETVIGGSNSVVAVITNRVHEVGIAVCDLRTLRITFTQFLDHVSYIGTINQIHAMCSSPNEIIFPNTLTDSFLIQLLRTSFSESEFTAIARRYFNEVQGVVTLQSLNFQEVVETGEKYLGLATMSAVLKYVEEIQHVAIAPGALWIQYRSRDRHMELSQSTVRSLQLIGPTRKAVKRKTATTESGAAVGTDCGQYSLLSFLRHTVTPMGQRLLISNILQPPSDEETITRRQEIVEFFLSEPAIHRSLTKTLGAIKVDMEHLVAYFSVIPTIRGLRSASQSIGNLLCVRGLLSAVESIAKVIYLHGSGGDDTVNDPFEKSNGCAGPLEEHIPQLLRVVCGIITHYHVSSMRNEFSLYFNPDGSECGSDTEFSIPLGATRHCYAIKEGVCSVLDAARQQYALVVDSMIEDTRFLQEKHGIPSLKLTFQPPRGFILTLDVMHDMNAPPNIFLQKNTSW